MQNHVRFCAHLLRNWLSIVACELKARIVTPADTAVAREGLCKHVLAKQWLSSLHMMNATDTQQQESSWKRRFMCDPYRGPAVITGES
jgi:hypothetical protein